MPIAPAVSSAALACTLAASATAALAQTGGKSVEIVGHVVSPAKAAPAPAALAAPEGFEIGVFAEDLVNPRMLAIADDGSVYVTRREVGDVVLLKDEDGDGRADSRRVVARRPQMHGIAIDGESVYLATVKEIYRADRAADGSLRNLRRIVDDLPDGGQHPNRTLAVGPDGKLYVSVGSTCNACPETDPESATILQIEPDGSSRKIFASGLRNTIGFAFHPQTGALYGMDHGIDWLGDDEQKEELNLIVEGARYGWPYVYADARINPVGDPPAKMTAQDWAAISAEPVGLYTAHSAPMQMAFYGDGDFPGRYKGDAFVAMRGSWNRKPPSGYEIVRIDFEDGEPVAFEPFITGFLQGEDDAWRRTGRPAGLATTPNGDILFTDDENGVIYRVSHTGGGDRTPLQAQAQQITASGARPTPPAATAEDLARDVVAQGARALSVRSAAFSDGAQIPDKFAAEGQNISPPISWRGGPSGTKSYAVLMEDPDADQPSPFVHWIVYDIPANARGLGEGVPAAVALAIPEGAKQGVNDSGAPGYFGMRPPIGDAPHAYHIQVFALNAPLGLAPGATRAEVLKALDGKVLAVGEIRGIYERAPALARN